MQDHEAWLKIAKEDLAVAKLLLKQEFFSPATYHCQQSAEKALKAYLVFKKTPVLKTHDLLQLLELSLKFDRDFQKIYEASKLLTPYATKFRYPSEFDIPDFGDAEQAIKHAQKILTFVLRKISEPATGQSDIFESI